MKMSVPVVPESGGLDPLLMQKTAIIIPARNEASNIHRVLESVRQCMPLADIVVVDDNSVDRTAEIARMFRRTVILQSPITLGIGGAVQLAVRYCLKEDYDLFLRIDGDGQHPAESLPEMVKIWRPGAMVQGSRSHGDFLGTSSGIRKIGSLYFWMLFKIFTGRNLPDPTSGLVCFGRDIAERFDRFFPSDFPEIESEVLLLRAGFEILPLRVSMLARQGGVSSINFPHAVMYMFSVSLAFLLSYLRKNPYSPPAKGAGIAWT